MERFNDDEKKEDEKGYLALFIAAASAGFLFAPWFAAPFVVKKTAQYLGEKAAEKWFGDK